MQIGNEDTIAAVSTRPGEAAVGIVKLSGDMSICIADKIFKSKSNKKLKSLDTYNMLYGHIIDKDGNFIDDLWYTAFIEYRERMEDNMEQIKDKEGVNDETNK